MTAHAQMGKIQRTQPTTTKAGREKQPYWFNDNRKVIDALMVA